MSERDPLHIALETAQPVSIEDGAVLRQNVDARLRDLEVSRPARAQSVRRWRIGGIVLAAGILGITTAAAAPSIFDSLNWSPDFASIQDFYIDGKGPIQCELRVVLHPSLGGQEAGEFDKIQRWAQTNDWDFDNSSAQLSRNGSGAAETDLGIISTYFSENVANEIQQTFPDWRSAVSSVQSAGSCKDVGENGMAQ